MNGRVIKAHSKNVWNVEIKLFLIKIIIFIMSNLNILTENSTLKMFHFLQTFSNLYTFSNQTSTVSVIQPKIFKQLFMHNFFKCLIKEELERTIDVISFQVVMKFYWFKHSFFGCLWRRSLNVLNLIYLKLTKLKF